MKRIDPLLMVALMWLAFSLGGFIVATSTPDALTYGGDTVSQCSSEDPSTDELPCVWDAARQGNGEGSSFLATATTTVRITTTDKD